jgi:hypothetical protein
VTRHSELAGCASEQAWEARRAATLSDDRLAQMVTWRSPFATRKSLIGLTFGIGTVLAALP